VEANVDSFALWHADAIVPAMSAGGPGDQSARVCLPHACTNAVSNTEQLSICTIQEQRQHATPWPTVVWVWTAQAIHVTAIAEGKLHPCHQCHRTDHVPFVSVTVEGKRTPADHCTSSGALGCRLRYQSGKTPRILTSGIAGASVNFSQQSCRVWWWASGSKQTSAPHQANVLQGSRSNGPACTRRNISIDSASRKECTDSRQVRVRSTHTQHTHSTVFLLVSIHKHGAPDPSALGAWSLQACAQSSMLPAKRHANSQTWYVEGRSSLPSS
jgi:hypothetical protein